MNNKANTKRRHSCSDCQGQELNQLEWEKHVKKYQKNYKKIWMKEFWQRVKEQRTKY